MPRTLAPMLAVRAAFIARAKADLRTATLAWHNGRAPNATPTPFIVWDASIETEGDALTEERVFRRAAQSTSDTFSIYADATTTLTGQERGYAIFAALKEQSDRRALTLGADALGTTMMTARVRVALVLLLDDPDVPGRAHLACRLDVTSWSL